ncbi:MAG: hypothetical protein ACR2O8_13955 [Rhizobiaceae bacterium]
MGQFGIDQAIVFMAVAGLIAAVVWRPKAVLIIAAAALAFFVIKATVT